MLVTDITPTIQVHHLDTSIDFFQTLGFSLDWKWPESSPTHASLSNSGKSFMLALIDLKQEIAPADLYFRVEHVSELRDRLEEQGISIGDLVKSDYGMLEFRISSPEGHQLAFGEPSGVWQG